MSENVVHTFPGQSASAVVKGYFGVFNSANKIAVSSSGGRTHGVISRSAGSGEATGLKFGICDVVAGAAITAGDAIASGSDGRARAAVAGDYEAGLATSSARSSTRQRSPRSASRRSQKSRSPARRSTPPSSAGRTRKRAPSSLPAASWTSPRSPRAPARSTSV